MARTRGFSTKEFTHDLATKTFTAEASELRLPIGFEFNELITLTSHKTGRVSTWKPLAERYNSDGELTGWTYVPAFAWWSTSSVDLDIDAALRGYTLIILND